MTQGNTHASDETDQSPSMVGLRTTVMIVFLVAIPLLAVMGTALPDSLRRLAQTSGVKLFAANSSSSSPAPIDSPSSPSTSPSTTSLVDAAPAPAEPRVEEPARGAPSPAQTSAAPQPAPPTDGVPHATVTDIRVQTKAPRAQITEVRTLPDGPPPSPTAPLWAPSPRTAASPHARQTMAHFQPPRRGGRAPAGRAAARKHAADAQLQATAFLTPAGSKRPHESQAAAEPQPANGLAQGESRLRELGATEYLLESWGDGGRLFRCTASVALSDRSRASRRFQSVASGPAEALEQLLAQIESWRAARR